MKLVSAEAIKKSRVCIMIDSTVDSGRPFHCLLYDVVCIPLPCATLEQTYTTFKEVYGVRDSAANTTKKALMPKHLVISNVIDHLA